MIKKHLILMGLPGSGKGTIAEALSKIEPKLIHISTGNILRNEIKSQSELGKEVENIMASGQYVSDEVVNKIIKKTFNEFALENKFMIFDGYPRTLNQAEFLDSFNNLNYLVVELNVSKELILKRISGRRVCPLCKEGYNIYYMPPKVENHCDNDNELLITRADDKPEAVEKRLEVFETQTADLLKYYKSKNKLVTVDGSLTPDVTVNKILEMLK